MRDITINTMQQRIPIPKFQLIDCGHQIKAPTMLFHCFFSVIQVANGLFGPQNLLILLSTFWCWHSLGICAPLICVCTDCDMCQMQAIWSCHALQNQHQPRICLWRCLSCHIHLCEARKPTQWIQCWCKHPPRVSLQGHQILTEPFHVKMMGFINHAIDLINQHQTWSCPITAVKTFVKLNEVVLKWSNHFREMSTPFQMRFRINQTNNSTMNGGCWVHLKEHKCP